MDIRYAAGFFDGEGCIRIDRIKVPASESRPSEYKRYQLKISLAQANPAPLLLFKEDFGGVISIDSYAKNVRPNSRIRHQWISWSRYAYEFLIAVRPHLIVKADEADIAISFFEEMDSNRTHFRKYRGNPPNKEEIMVSRETQITMLAELKRRNYSPVNSGPNSP